MLLSTFLYVLACAFVLQGGLLKLRKKVLDLELQLVTVGEEGSAHAEVFDSFS